MNDTKSAILDLIARASECEASIVSICDAGLDRRDLAAEAADRLVGNPDAIWVEVYDVITDPRLGHAEKLDMAKCLLTTAHSVILTLRRHIRDGARS